MKFVVHGKILLGGEERKFSKQIVAATEKAAKETAYSLLGASHRANRAKIKIEGIEKA